MLSFLKKLFGFENKEKVEKTLEEPVPYKVEPPIQEVVVPQQEVVVKSDEVKAPSVKRGRKPRAVKVEQPVKKIAAIKTATKSTGRKPAKSKA